MTTNTILDNCFFVLGQIFRFLTRNNKNKLLTLIYRFLTRNKALQSCCELLRQGICNFMELHGSIQQALAILSFANTKKNFQEPPGTFIHCIYKLEFQLEDERPDRHQHLHSFLYAATNHEQKHLTMTGRRYRNFVM